jgi:hypothetical protein
MVGMAGMAGMADMVVVEEVGTAAGMVDIIDRHLAVAATIVHMVQDLTVGLNLVVADMVGLHLVDMEIDMGIVAVVAAVEAAGVRKFLC